MSHAELARTIDAAFDNRNEVGPATAGPVREAVETALDLLDRGAARVAEKGADGTWRVNQWLKKAVLLSFRLNDMEAIPGGPGHAAWWDKVPSKFAGWDDNRFRDAGFRAVPGWLVRPDRPQLPHLGRRRDRWRARAVAGGSGDRRGQLLHRRARRSGGRRGGARRL